MISDEPPQDFFAAGGFFRWSSSPENFAHFVAGSNLHLSP
jgi:hypothetical protein